MIKERERERENKRSGLSKCGRPAEPSSPHPDQSNYSARCRVFASVEDDCCHRVPFCSIIKPKVYTLALGTELSQIYKHAKDQLCHAVTPA
jgi:hypothetical protein